MKNRERIWAKTERLSRERACRLLQQACIETYDYESILILREALIVNVLDGTIPEKDLDDLLEETC